MNRIVGLGAGGHAKVLVDILRLRGEYEIIGLTDPDARLWGQHVLGVPVLGDDSHLPALLAQGVQSAFIGVGSVGDNRARQKLYEHALTLGFEIAALIHPSAIIAPSVALGRGVMVMAGAIINADARVGDNVIINSGAIVEHDCVLENHVHLATGAKLASTVHVREGAHVGVGASVRQCVTVGARAIVGGGAMVVRDVPAGVTVVGVPAVIK